MTTFLGRLRCNSLLLGASPYPAPWQLVPSPILSRKPRRTALREGKIVCWLTPCSFSKRYGTRWTMAFGSLFLAGGQIAAGFVTKIWQLFLTQGVMFAVGLGLIMVSNQPIVAQWFGKKRGLASGIAGAGSGAGGLIYSNLTRYLLQKKGLRWAFLVNGLTSAAVMLPCTILMKCGCTSSENWFCRPVPTNQSLLSPCKTSEGPI